VRSRHRWDDNIKEYIRETECQDADWIQMAQWPTVMNLHYGVNY